MSLALSETPKTGFVVSRPICASAGDFGSYCINELYGLWQVCTYLQTHHSLSFSHTQSMDKADVLGQILHLKLIWPRGYKTFFMLNSGSAVAQW